ncbi:CU044_2847 family protein [Kitasatospora sp. NPDC058444]|uniref:CU044_2847 family protein n=1 Tax=Kitasatospora sp. NPDC058444 TaxID=3346504 RepID=UPI00364CD06C
MEPGAYEVDLGDGTTILVLARTADGSEAGPTDVGLRQAMSFTAVAGAVRRLSSELHDAVRAARPDEVEIEFGLELGIKSSRLLAVLADGESKATFQVRLKWTGNSSGDGAEA